MDWTPEAISWIVAGLLPLVLVAFWSIWALAKNAAVPPVVPVVVEKAVATGQTTVPAVRNSTAQIAFSTASRPSGLCRPSYLNSASGGSRLSEADVSADLNIVAIGSNHSSLHSHIDVSSSSSSSTDSPSASLRFESGHLLSATHSDVTSPLAAEGHPHTVPTNLATFDAQHTDANDAELDLPTPNTSQHSPVKRCLRKRQLAETPKSPNLGAVDYGCSLPNCDKTFTSLKGLKDHEENFLCQLDVSHRRVLKCPNCPKVYVHICDLRKHELTCRKHPNANPDRKLRKKRKLRW